MTSIPARRIWEPLHDRFGEDLRGVTRYEGTDYDAVMREDVRAMYADDDDQALVDETVVAQLGEDRIERILNVGPLVALVRVFDDAWLLSWPDPMGPKSGVIVFVDRESEVARNDGVEEVIEALGAIFDDVS